MTALLTGPVEAERVDMRDAARSTWGWIVRDSAGHAITDYDLRTAFELLAERQADERGCEFGNMGPHEHGHNGSVYAILIAPSRPWPERIAEERVRWERERAVERHLAAELALEWTAEDQARYNALGRDVATPGQGDDAQDRALRNAELEAVRTWSPCP